MIQYLDAWQDGNSRCFLNGNGQYLLSQNNKTDEIKYIGYLDDNRMKSPMRRTFLYKKNVYLVSYAGLIIYKCDWVDGIYQGKLEYCDELEKSIRVSDAFFWNSSIIIVPNDIKKNIYIYDIDKHKCEKKKSICEMLKRDEKDTVSEVKMIEKNLIFSLSNDSNLYSLDLNDWKVHIIRQFSCNIGSFDFVDDSIWIRDCTGVVVQRWINGTGENKVFQLGNQLKDEYGKIVCVNHITILLPGLSNKFVYINNSDDRVYEFETNEKIIRDEKYSKSPFLFGGILFGERYCIYPWASGDNICIDLKNMKIIKSDYCISKSIEKEYWSSRFSDKNIIYETANSRLEDFMCFLSCSSGSDK